MKTSIPDLAVEDKILVARGWHSSGLDQSTYASFHGISPRTLRSWIQRYAPTGMPLERARQIIERAISDLQVLLEQLDADEPPTPEASAPQGVSPGPTTSAPAEHHEPAPCQDLALRQPPPRHHAAGMPHGSSPSTTSSGAREVPAGTPRRKRGTFFDDLQI